MSGDVLRFACAVVGMLVVGAFPHVAQAVVPGVPTGAAAYPATGALIAFYGDTPRLACTGTLIAADVVLTAAHCMSFLGRRLPDFLLKPSIADATTETARRTLQVVLHPHYVVQADRMAPLHDLALVLLAEPIRGVRPEPLLLEHDAAAIAVGDRVDLVGYGRMSSASVADEGTKNRGSSTLAEVRPSEWVVGVPGGAQNCDGDSGGPAFVTIRGKRRLMGIVSRSRDTKAPCTSGTIHVRLDAEAPWIAATLRDFERARRARLGGPSARREMTSNGP